MKYLEIKGRSDVCHIEVGVPVARLGSYCDPDKTVIITDGAVRGLYGHLFQEYEVVEIGTGEGSKMLDTVEGIYERFFSCGLDRTSFVAGVVRRIVDCSGFAASTYLPGCFRFCPHDTSLPS